jgi:sulfur carrier protein ThiS
MPLAPIACCEYPAGMTPATDVRSATAEHQGTIHITLKLFALLSGYLPDGAERNQVELEVPAASTPVSVMVSLNLPTALCALVVLNGVFVRVADRATRELVDSDVLAIWPPIAGG